MLPRAIRHDVFTFVEDHMLKSVVTDTAVSPGDLNIVMLRLGSGIFLELVIIHSHPELGIADDISRGGDQRCMTRRPGFLLCLCP